MKKYQEFLFVEIPEKMRDFETHDDTMCNMLVGNSHSVYDKWTKVIPDGYELVGISDHVYTEQAERITPLVYDGSDDPEIGLLYECYDGSEMVCNNALASYISLIKAAEVEYKRFAILKKQIYLNVPC